MFSFLSAYIRINMLVWKLVGLCA